MDVAALVQHIPVNKRIVNKNDEHPSVLVHELVARGLYEKLRQEGLISPDKTQN